MWKRRWCTYFGLFLIFSVSFITGGYAQEGKKFTTGAFVNVNRLDTDLQRGVSTKMDVRQMLGAPNGMGGASLPTDPKQREVWYYASIEMKDMKREEGVFKVNMRQQVLLVFFEKGVYDGYMWFTNTGKAEAR